MSNELAGALAVATLFFDSYHVLQLKEGKSLVDIKEDKAFRKQSLYAHPNKGGTEEAFRKLQYARDLARKKNVDEGYMNEPFTKALFHKMKTTFNNRELESYISYTLAVLLSKETLSFFRSFEKPLIEFIDSIENEYDYFTLLENNIQYFKDNIAPSCTSEFGLMQNIYTTLESIQTIDYIVSPLTQEIIDADKRVDNSMLDTLLSQNQLTNTKQLKYLIIIKN